jgi:hypothetical protein
MKKLCTYTLAAAAMVAGPAYANLLSLPEAITLETQQQNIEAALAAYRSEAKGGKPEALKKVAEAESALKALEKEKKKVHKNVKTQGLCKLDPKQFDEQLQRSADASVMNLKTMQPKADEAKLKKQAAESVRRFKAQKGELCPEG